MVKFILNLCVKIVCDAMATTISIPFPSPLKMSGTLSTEWKRFRGQWENYVVAIKLPDDYQQLVALLLS